jgi:hypothetical protein
MKLPTYQQCLDWYEEFKVPHNIREHCFKVRELSLFLAKELRKKGINLSLELVECTALLHDLFKVVSLKELTPTKHHNYVFSAEETAMWRFLREKYPGMYEGEVAYHFFNDEYPELAFALRNVSDTKVKDKSWEEIVVHYADWRVFRNEIVSLQERTFYLQEAYPRGIKFWEEEMNIISSYERKILERINLNPDQINEELLKVHLHG